jgi:diguanylate cyclase (GGDEF)-like protein/PAS domain S-box-containing protein
MTSVASTTAGSEWQRRAGAGKAQARVLCIEDDNGTARLIQRRLTRAGFEVDIARTGAAGLARYADRPYDAVALDFDLPDANGLDLLRHLRDSSETSPEIVFVTGAGNEEVAVAAMQSGARHYLVKDSAGRYLELLPTAIDRALKQRNLEHQSREMARALEESEARFRTLVEHAPEAILLFDPGLERFVDGNEKAFRLYGMERQALSQLGPVDLSPLSQPDGSSSRTSHDRYIRQTLAGDTPNFEWQYRTGSGKAILCDVRLVRIMMKGRALVRASVTDITEKKMAQDALFEERERARVTLHSIGDAVVATDVSGRIEYMNPVAETMTGWSLKEAKGQPLLQVFRILDERDRQSAPDPIARCISEGKVIELSNDTLLISRNGREYGIQDSAAPIRNSVGEITGVVLVFTDATESRRMALQITHQATHDSLTGLVNRAEFERRLENVWTNARTRGSDHTLCFLDLDHFKLVNDTVGHAAGDEMLKKIAKLLRDGVRNRDTVARVGGDEFCLILEHCPLERATSVAESLVSAVENCRLHWGGRSFRVGVSIGIVPISPREPPVRLLTRADLACYAAKDLGRNRVHVYRSSDREPNRRRGEISRAAGLRDALDNGRFSFYCQPVVSVKTAMREVKHFEVLIRLLDTKGHLSPPATFIPAAERYGLMPAVDRWVLETFFRRWAEPLARTTDAGFAINLSGSSLSDEAFLEFAMDEVKRSGFPPDRVCFEITETAAISRLASARQFMKRLKTIGCLFALDDFGSGLSSLAYLKSLPVDYLKIDGRFVRDMITDNVDRSIIQAVSQMGHAIKLRTIAEGVENPQVVQELKSLNIDLAQGYALGRPFPMDRIA